MEGVGARLGRSSTRYGPTIVFTGPVRKWKKKWIPLTPPNSNNGINHHHQTAANGNNGSHLLLYKWTTTAPSQNYNNNGNGNRNGDNNGDSNNSGEDDAISSDELPKRKFKYIPVAVLEEQKNEALEQVDGEAKPMETEKDSVELNSKSDGFDEKPDINDVPAEESQAPENGPLGRQDLNESILDLSLGLNSHDRENDYDLKIDQNKDEELVRANMSGIGT
ncbi:hypothetical protein ACH5RR_014730 [Cinchona calisaya]|uniref:Uncharacterized protein n=1 Tax=Cinchona calisaya TaxID=153742 RepID=A0ABD2ZR43_9GENT